MGEPDADRTTLTFAEVRRDEALKLYAWAAADLDPTLGLGRPLPAADHYLRLEIEGYVAGLAYFRPAVAFAGLWYFVALSPAWRDRRLGRRFTAVLARWVFEHRPDVMTVVAGVRTTNARSLASLKANPVYRLIGVITDAVAPGVDYVLAQITRDSLAAALHSKSSA